MSETQPSPPILFLVYNRPRETRRSFESIRAARPDRLFVSADGPREDRPGEDALCRETRDAVLNRIDWPCHVHTLFRERNQGCKLAVSSAIHWFFEQVEEGIILEDDCLAHPSFFPFCAELLAAYRDHEHIMMISGDNFQPVRRGPGSYYFSRYVHIWGWATWRRAWRWYDLSMKDWPRYRDEGRLRSVLTGGALRRREQLFEAAYRGRESTWDIQWVFACWNRDGLSAVPNINLVSNIAPSGTHMKVYDPGLHRPAERMDFPLVHPGLVASHPAADAYTTRYVVLRGWSTTLRLILGYLAKTARESPAAVPGAVREVVHGTVAEIRRRLRWPERSRRQCPATAPQIDPSRPE